jgi:hypothetical protein
MIVASLTNIGFIAGQILARDRAASDPRRYVPADLIAALDWMSANATDGAVLFSSYFTGNLAPSITGRRVYLGHYGQTIASDEKGRQVAAFYSGVMDERAARQLFRDHRISHVIYGPFEREISPNFVAPAWLKLVHRAGDVEIYSVID